MLSSNSLFECETTVLYEDFHDEIFSQLYYLQMHCVKFLFSLIKETSANITDLVSVLRSFVEVGVEIYYGRGVNPAYVFQCGGQLLRLLGDSLIAADKTKLAKMIIVGLLSLRLVSELPCESTIISDMLLNAASGTLETSKIDFRELRDAFVKQPYIAKTLVNIVYPHSQMKELYFSCLDQAIRTYEDNSESCLKMLHLICQFSSIGFSIDAIKPILSFSRNRKCLLEHLTLEISLSLPSEQRYLFSLSLRDQVISDIIRNCDQLPEKIVDGYEQLCYCLFVNGFPATSNDADSLSQMGWLILVTQSRSTISLLLNVIKTLIEARLFEPLTRLLKSPNMSEFNQLLLVNLWHPNLADEAARQILLELCYPFKTTEIQPNYIEQLCIKIRTRRETLKKFNERLSSLNKEQEKPTKEILALTTIGNTSHLELATVLPDPTGLDMKVVLDILDRTGCGTADSSIGTRNSNLSLETEVIEENCDKSIFYCAVSIRKLWECLVLFSSIETRQTIFAYLHQQNIMMDVDVIPAEMCFCVQFQQALQNNDMVTCDELYQTCIVRRLEYLTRHIDKINPPALRLELLENLYSMLFLTEGDLFADMLTLNHLSLSNRPMWPLPETSSAANDDPDTSDDEIALNFDKNRFVCSFFLFKDLLRIVHKSLQSLNIATTNDLGPVKSRSADIKMAKLINYPTIEDIKARVDQLATTVNDMQWRIDLLTIKNMDVKGDDMCILDMPICILYHSSSKNVFDAHVTKSNMRNRSKSNAHSRKGQTKSRKERLSSHGEEKDSAHLDLSPKVMQLGITQSAASLTHNLSSQHNKDRFILFQPPALTDTRDSFTTYSTDEGENINSKVNEHQRISKRISKGQCQFLMDCVPLLVEPIGQLAVVILNHGYIDRAQEIFKKYGHIKTENTNFNALLSEIQYRYTFDDLTSQLSAITIPADVTNQDSPDKPEAPQFGNFNWSKLSALNSKLSSRKENEVVEILNQLLTLEHRSRPSVHLDESSGLLSKEFTNGSIKHFNYGLLFDIAIVGSNTHWQLSQMMTLIESHCTQSDSPSSDPACKMIDSPKYHKVQSLITITKQLQKALPIEVEPNRQYYTELEMISSLDLDYCVFMKLWLEQLETSLKSLQIDEHGGSSADAQSGSHSLDSLISFIQATCVESPKKELPFKYLNRPIPQYLEALYSHLKVFANFLSKYKHSHNKLKKPGQNSSLQLKHEFSIMKRSLLDALGELIFLKSEDPLSLEMLQISEDLGLNISLVVLENCIPTISSRGNLLSPEVDDLLLNHQRGIYNPSSEPQQEDIGKLNPMEVVTDCLNKVIKIMQKNVFTFNQATDPTNPTMKTSQNPWNVLVSTFSGSSLSMDTSSSESSSKSRESNTTQYKSTTPNTNSSNVLLNSGWRVLLMFSNDDDWRELLIFEFVDLENVDLDLLNTNSEKAAFFINLYNLMMIHMAVVIVESGRTNLKYRSLESKLLRSNFCYKVGQIGVVSIEEISEHYLNIPDITFTDLDLGISEITSSLPTPMELSYRSKPSSHQNLTLFGLVDVTVSGQPLRVYHPESLLKDLQSNLSYIIKYKTTYESDKRQIFLPQIFKWYSKFICADSSDQKYGQGSDVSNTDEVLIERILSKCTEKVAQKFSLLLRLDTDTITHNIKEQTSNKLLKIIWQSRSEAIGCSVIDQRPEVMKTIPKLLDCNPGGPSSLNSMSSVISEPSFPLPNYQPTLEALNHLRDRSPLLACLAYLIIGNDFISIPTRPNEENSTSEQTATKSRSMSSVEMEDKLKEIHSFKYSRISHEYPAIGNWILTFWSAWLMSRKPGQSLNSNESPVMESLMTYCCSGIPIEIRWAAFTHPLTKGLDQILIEYSLNVMSRDQHGYLDIGAAMRALQTQTIANSYKLQRLLDIILKKCARYWANGLIINTNSRKHLPPDNTSTDCDSLRLQEERLLDCIYAMKDRQLRLSESTRYLDLFHIRNAVILMEFIYNSSPNDATEELKRQIVILRIFKRIHDLVLTCQRNDQIWGKAHIPTEFLDWHRLQTISEHDPDLVLKFLIKQSEFDLAKCWSCFYMLEDGEQKIEAEYLVSLVGEDNDKEKVVELVSHIVKLHREKSPNDFMRIVDHVIGHSDAPFAIIMICAYIIKRNLFDEFESKEGIVVCEWRDLVHRSWVGASMLRAMSNEVIREQYSQLVQHPHLIMEQLIMNAEIDVFRKMMDLYKEQKKVYHNIMRPQNENKLQRFSSIDDFVVELEAERINSLLTTYICKALELSAVREDEDVDGEDFSPSSRYMSLRSDLIRPDVTNFSESVDTVVSANFGQLSMLETMSADETYSMPALPPPPHLWTKDSEAPKCMCCSKEKFSMFNRRHHCRRCGHVICSQCSTHRTLIEGVTVRICDNCFRSINHGRDSLHRAKISSVAELLYSRHNLPQRSESISSLPSVEGADLTSPNMLQLGIGALENGWRLGIDAVENETIRQMFNYDDAPSVTIAFCLADFHSNSNACGNVLLDRVEYLADFLKPMKNHLPNPEVDYLLVLDIAKQITYKAKLKFSRLNNDTDFDRAENYLSRLDLLNVLVKSNFGSFLPSLSDGSKFIERIESLRDKLIREERLELAGIVSNKAGLSTDPVFVAMGLHALEECKYEEARKLFASCSRIGRYGSQAVSSLPYPVNDIMKILEGNRLSVESAKEMLMNIADSEDLLKMPDLKFKDREMNRKQMEEAVYYLDTYNAPLHCLQFLCRQHMWSKAVDYVFKKNVSREVFIDGLILPAITIGHFASVKSEILMKEGGLSSWKIYYEPLCKCLDKKGCFDDLLEFQEKMGDRFQAARTLTNHFYLRGAQSYTVLKERICFLEKAYHHLEILSKRKDKDPNIELPKLTKNLLLIKHQMEVTLFLADPLTISRHKAKLGYIVRPNNPPTLFGGSEAILDLCLTILFCRANLADGLQLLCPLMLQCHIYPELVLPKAAVWLLQHPQLVLPSTNVESDTTGVLAVLDMCTNICSCYRLDSRKSDDVLLAILPVIPLSLLTKSNRVNQFISLLKSESKKIDAYIVVKDFKRGYSSSVNFGYANEVQRILELAEAADDNSGVIDLCKRWLAQNKSSDQQKL